MAEYVEKGIKMTDEDGETIEMTIKGKSVVPFFNNDLSFKAAIALLENMDYKDFYESNQRELYENLVAELKEISDRMNSNDW